MNILYVSSLVSDRLFEDFVSKSLTKEFVGQKYHGLFARGLAKNLKADSVTALSQPPIAKNFWKCKDYEAGVTYRYIPILHIPFLKQVFSFLYSFLFTLYWAIKHLGQDKVIICSVMRLYQYIPVQLAMKFFTCTKVTVACDVPWMTLLQVSNTHTRLSYKTRLSIALSKKVCASFDLYILLTEAMNSILNPNQKPHIVIEGFSDVTMKKVANELALKNKKDVVMYAGGLNEAYGILNLVEAVKKSSNPDIELWLFGNGDLSQILQQETNSRIKYFGGRSNKEVVQAEIEATLLINPRPTTGEYTHYSFPSKTLEYMASGTYTLTTQLAGIPSEYYNYCGIIDDFDTSGIQHAIEATLTLGRQELHHRGMQGKMFVLTQKNNVVQTAKVIDFINQFKR